MSKTSEAKAETVKPKAETIPIQIVLRRDASGELHQQPLTPEERQQLRDRYDEIENCPQGRRPPFYEAFYQSHNPAFGRVVALFAKTRIKGC